MKITTEPSIKDVIGTEAAEFPDEQADSSDNHLNYKDGFPAVTEQLPSQGGKPPRRADFNAVFNLFSRFAQFAQSGGAFKWNAARDYLIGSQVLGSNGSRYLCVSANGANYGGAKDPADAANSADYGVSISGKYWLNLDSLYDASRNLANAAGTLSLAKGGTGADNAAAARTNLDAAKTAHTHTTGDITNMPAIPDIPHATIITTSGTWAAPKTGKYRITAVGGGAGGGPRIGTNGTGGGAGKTISAVFAFNKGKVCSAVIGAGGIGGYTGGFTPGGATVFTVDPLTADNPVSVITAEGGIVNFNGEGSSQDGQNSSFGLGGLNTDWAGSKRCPPSGYGAGGYGGFSSQPGSDGTSGCVLIEYLGA
jgi:hypothetical protein